MAHSGSTLSAAPLIQTRRRRAQPRELIQPPQLCTPSLCQELTDAQVRTRSRIGLCSVKRCARTIRLCHSPCHPGGRVAFVSTATDIAHCRHSMSNERRTSPCNAEVRLANGRAPPARASTQCAGCREGRRTSAAAVHEGTRGRRRRCVARASSAAEWCDGALRARQTRRPLGRDVP